MFSGLSKLADKAFLVGYFIPALLGLASFILANQDLTLFAHWLASAQQGEKGLGDVIAVLFAIWTLAVALMGLNDVAIRFLEGYYWPFTLNWFVKRQVKRYHMLADLYFKEKRNQQSAEKYAEKLSRIDPQKQTAASADHDAKLRKIRIRKNRLREKLVRQYTTNETSILGTRLGNTLRAFEKYPDDVYGAASIVIWPRLLDVMSKEYHEELRDARATFDMCASFILVLSIVALSATCRFVIYLYLNQWGLAVRFAVTTLAATAVTQAFYWLAIHNARVWWGEVFKGAYDLYLRALAEKLGCEAPLEPSKRRRFWRQVSRQLRYHEAVDLSEFAKEAIDETAEAATEAGVEEPELDDEEPNKKTYAPREEKGGEAGETRSGSNSLPINKRF
jgi:hypothetical protein